MKLSLICPSVGGESAATVSWITTASTPYYVTVYGETEGKEAGYLQKLQRGYLEHSDSDILGYMHADLTIHEKNWDLRVLKEFENPRVGVVSFCGATQHGHEDIYKIPYDYRQLARSGFMSNLDDAEDHGIRRRDEANVAVVDSFSCFVRRELLDRNRGWPVDRYYPCHCSDYWLCAMAQRLGYRVRFVGVACRHASGGSHLGSFDYIKWCEEVIGVSNDDQHKHNHRLFYDEFRDILPVKVKP